MTPYRSPVATEGAEEARASFSALFLLVAWCCHASLPPSCTSSFQRRLPSSLYLLQSHSSGCYDCWRREIRGKDQEGYTSNARPIAVDSGVTSSDEAFMPYSTLPTIPLGRTTDASATTGTTDFAFRLSTHLPMNGTRKRDSSPRGLCPCLLCGYPCHLVHGDDSLD